MKSYEECTDELMTIKGIGRERAQTILAYIGHLDNLKSIGKTFAKKLVLIHGIPFVSKTITKRLIEKYHIK